MIRRAYLRGGGRCGLAGALGARAPRPALPRPRAGLAGALGVSRLFLRARGPASCSNT